MTMSEQKWNVVWVCQDSGTSFSYLAMLISGRFSGKIPVKLLLEQNSIHKSSRFGNPRGLIGHFNLYYSYYRGYEHAPAQKWIVYPWKNKFLP